MFLNYSDYGQYRRKYITWNCDFWMENPSTVPVLHAWLLVVGFFLSLFLIVCIVLIEHLLPVEDTIRASSYM